MSALRRLVVLTIFGLFVLTLLLRPITRVVSRGFTGDGFDASALFLSLPGVVVLAVMLLVGVSVLRRNGEDSPSTVGEVLTTTSTGSPEPARNPDEERTPMGGDTPEGDGDIADAPDGEQSQPRFHSGQGGTRSKGFEIEEEPPETDVDEHMQYLRETLEEDDFESEPDDTKSSGEADENEKSPSPETTPNIPEQCPQPYCDAEWASGGLLGGRGGGYEVLNDGEQVRCEKCDGITTLE